VKLWGEALATTKSSTVYKPKQNGKPASTLSIQRWQLESLLLGPKTGCLQILEKKKIAKREKILHFCQKYVFTAMNDKISIKNVLP
jgi:hypothetical protein